jgi:hypothetical protein
MLLNRKCACNPTMRHFWTFPSQSAHLFSSVLILIIVCTRFENK